MATEVRTGLELVHSGPVKPIKKTPPSKLDEIRFYKPVRVLVQEFGTAAAMLLCLIGLLSAYFKGVDPIRELVLVAAATVFVFVGKYAPIVLYPVWATLMFVGHYMGMVMTTVILGLAWCLALLPIATALKIFRVRVMDCTFSTQKSTYWEDRDEKLNDFKLLERQF